jgi:hypothetical protein
MIVWLASYPRSGNTFLRIVLHRLFGLPTYSIYDDDDPVAQRVGTDLVGYRPKPDRETMVASNEVYFTKTHKRRKADQFPAIYLVRDGRDAVVSHARLRYSMQNPEAGQSIASFEDMLRKEITRPFVEDQPSSGTWGGNVLNWLDSKGATLQVLRYEELMSDPCASVVRAVEALVPSLVSRESVEIPSFDELHSTDPDFFRRGVVRSHRDEMPQSLHELFWAQPENEAAMKALGYVK